MAASPSPERKKLEAEARLYNAQAIQEEKKVREFDARRLLFNLDVDEFSMASVVEQLHDFALASTDPVTLVMCSPGGNIFDGLLLYDTVRMHRAQGTLSHVTIEVYGYAASMAAVLSQAADHRLIGKQAWFMVHEPSTILMGKTGSIKREAKLMEQLHDQLCGILAERSTLNKTEIKRRSTDKDWWMTATEAFNLGFFDEVA